ncbi:MAG: hypothetical protein M3Z50_01780 [Actinomycetota bacterium]|nr:hypothetical protein [Actinomycetota bacterium]
MPGSTAPLPWTPASLRACVAAYEQVAAHRAWLGLPLVSSKAPDLDGWAHLAAEQSIGAGLGLDPGLVHALAEFVGDWRGILDGDVLVHSDVRADNLLLSPSGAVVVDWSFGAGGTAWHDLAQLALDVLVDGTEAAQRDAVSLLDQLGTDGRRLAAAVCGMLTWNSTLPGHVGLPTFRDWQRHRATATHQWLPQLLF